MEGKPIKQYQVNPANNHVKDGSAPLIFSEKTPDKKTGACGSPAKRQQNSKIAWNDVASGKKLRG